jgi:FAD binding domain
VDGDLARDVGHASFGAGGMLFFFPLVRSAGSLRLRDPVWLTYFRLHHRHATRYKAGRVLLAGDAAHVHSPAGTQEMNTGIQEACNLAWKLALVVRGIADGALLDTCEAERRPIGRFVLRLTDRAAPIATSESRVLSLPTHTARTAAGTARAASLAREGARFPHPRTAPHPLPPQPGCPRRRAGAQPRAEGRRPSPRCPHRP